MSWYLIVSIGAAFILLLSAIVTSRIDGKLNGFSLILLWLSIVSNMFSVKAMQDLSLIRANEGIIKNQVSQLHGVFGYVGFISLCTLTVIATILYFGSNHEAKKKFYSWSRYIILLWLIPFVMGIFVA